MIEKINKGYGFPKRKMMEDYLKNFAMFIPNDIERHLDGSPVMFIKYKSKFIVYCDIENIDLEQLSVREREELYKKWEDANIDWLKNADTDWATK